MPADLATSVAQVSELRAKKKARREAWLSGSVVETRRISIQAITPRKINNLRLSTPSLCVTIVHQSGSRAMPISEERDRLFGHLWRRRSPDQPPAAARKAARTRPGARLASPTFASWTPAPRATSGCCGSCGGRWTWRVCRSRGAAPRASSKCWPACARWSSSGWVTRPPSWACCPRLRGRLRAHPQRLRLAVDY